MKNLTLLFLIALSSLNILAQDINTEFKTDVLQNFPAGTIPRYHDTLYQQSLKELEIPDNQKSVLLPAIVDNSKLPFLRPVFYQEGASCGQAASVGYNFTYEINHARNLSAKEPENQYPTHFVYNFSNTGYEYFGVSYFNSFEILQKCGTMNVVDYGGLTDDGGRWISGYDLYYHGMQNRLEEIYTIKTNSEKGIKTLKNWLFNHLGESASGGVANFYAGSPWNATMLAAGTPEAGRHVITNFSVPASHAMTIVGYNDSIRYDYNSDGLYTNDIDQNQDGIVDVKDWEIGAFKFVNSYGDTGPSSTDSGFCYMMYRTLAVEYANGSVWNNAVHVIKTKPVYKPLLTMKVRIKDTQRNTIRVRAGISLNTESHIPDHVIEFPIFAYQGGNFPMQGHGDSDTLSTIEFGLDITPLLSFTENGKDAVYFLSVEENDPFSQAEGVIENVSVIDYSGPSPIETLSEEVPVAVSNNDISYARIVTHTSVSKVRIQHTELQPLVAGEPYTFQLAATGGTLPYTWSINYPYSVTRNNQPMPGFNGIKLNIANPFDSIVAVPLGFDFPFYGASYDTVYVNPSNGYAQFNTENIPWPYFDEENLFMRSFRMITPMSNKNLGIENNDEGAWVHQEPTSVTFKWLLSKKVGETYFPLTTMLKLSADGSIVFNIGKVELTDYELIQSGISNGDKLNYELSCYNSDFSANLYNQVKFIPAYIPEDLKISSSGLVSCKPVSLQKIYEIPCNVTDYRGIMDSDKLLLSSALTATIHIKAGADSTLGAGESVFADLIISNLTASTIDNVVATFSSNNNYVSLSDSVENAGAIQPNSSKTIENAFKIQTSALSPDNETFVAFLKLSSGLQNWQSSFSSKISSSQLKSVDLRALSTSNKLLRPGETGTIRYKVANIGHAAARDISIKVSISHPDVEIRSNTILNVGDIVPGAKAIFDFDVQSDDSTMLGTLIPVFIAIESANELIMNDTMSFRIGRSPALVIDMDVNHESAPVILQQIRDLNYNADYTHSIKSDINEYQSVFLTLGKYSDRHILSYAEGMVLAEFLENGGNLYLESRNFWRDDLITSLTPRFETTFTNKFNKYDTISGSEGSFMYGIALKNGSTYPISMYYIKPKGNAFSIFNDGIYTCGVANDAGTYKTIGCIFEFSSLEGIDESSNRAVVMQKYIDFFNLKKNAIGINENTEFVHKSNVQVTPNPATQQVSLNFTMNSSGKGNAEILDLNGKCIYQTSFNAGIGTATTLIWNLTNQSGKKVNSGIYLCRIVNGNEIITGKIVVQ